MKSSTLLMVALSMSALGAPIGAAGGQAMRRTPLPRGDTAMIQSAVVAARSVPAAQLRQEAPAGSGRRRAIVGGIIGGVIGAAASGFFILNQYSCAYVSNPGLGECDKRGMNVVIPVALIGGTAAGAWIGSWAGRHRNDGPINP
jgi:hypothetical protein